AQDVLNSIIWCSICNSVLKQNIIMNKKIVLHKKFLCLCCKNCFEKLCARYLNRPKSKLKKFYFFNIQIVADNFPSSKIGALLNGYQNIQTKNIEKRLISFSELCKKILVNTYSLISDFQYLFNDKIIESLNNTIKSLLIKTTKNDSNIFSKDSHTTNNLVEHATNILQKECSENNLNPTCPINSNYASEISPKDLKQCSVQLVRFDEKTIKYSVGETTKDKSDSKTVNNNIEHNPEIYTMKKIKLSSKEKIIEIINPKEYIIENVN
ncbi:hypothetical protein QTP88_023444, partial [Uroleucon formosanum]